MGGLHFAPFNIFGCPGKQFSDDVPLPPGRARCKRYMSNCSALIFMLVLLAIAISALANPLVWTFACIGFFAVLCQRGARHFDD